MKSRLWPMLAMCGMLLLAFAQSALAANLTLPAIFCDNMVLQRGIKVPVWGTANPGDQVTVTFLKQHKSVKADAQGNWMVKLDKLKAGGPFEMTIASGTNTITYKNVLIGEVWVCSGQSNMEMVVRSSRNSADEIANSANQNIRLFTVRKKVSTAPLSTLDGQWTVCGPDTVGSFSAAGYFFGRELQKRLNVPVGLIHTSWGGTPAEAWTSHDFLLKDPDFQPILSRYKVPAGVDPVAAQKDYEKKLAEYDAKKYQVDPGNKGEGLGWAKTDFADANWQTAKLPGLWDASGSKMDIDGAVWYRKDIQLPNDWAGKSLTLSLGAIDDFDVTYFNGVKVGAIDEKTNEYWAYPRTYTIPAELVKPGRNVIAVRVFDHFGSGGFNGTVDQMTLALAGAATTKPLTLAGMWKMNVELAMKPVPAPTPVYTMNQNAPSTLYNGMLNPIIPFGIKGAIWYQGESNAGRSYQYRKLFPAMITSWRKAWGEGDFPFIFVQLANYMQRRDFPTESGWAELREAQTMTLATKNTGMAVIIDIGEGDNIHPKNKQDVGKRLELAAEHVAYNKKIVYSGPMYKSMEVDHNTIRLHFTSVGSGLMIKDGTELKGFSIAGQDKHFVWAKAVIDGNCVVVSSDAVAAPVAVRYAWADNPECNLYNKEGLPASPFRTDDWQGITMGKL